ncbi:MAG: phage antirepressor N-terminal domain-containing protein [Duncaniella sp.]|nr:phage antirepressor N-terminal domain-containing protein [Duncaniella sp.]
MNQSLICKINGVDIVTVNREGEIFVPIRPICDALAIDAKVQRRKLASDDFFNSVEVIMTSTGADGKQYEMTCIPLRDVYGWLATINPGKVAPEAREAVTRYRRECYDVLYEHFSSSMRRTIEANNAEIDLLKQINSAISDEKEAKGRRRKAEESLSKLRAERLNPTPSLFIG